MKQKGNKFYFEAGDYELAKKAYNETQEIEIFAEHTGPFGETQKGVEVISFDPGYSKFANYYDPDEKWDDMSEEDKEYWDNDEDSWAEENPYFCSEIVVLSENIGQSNCDFCTWSSIYEDLWVDAETAKLIMTQAKGAWDKTMAAKKNDAKTHVVHYDMEVESFRQFAEKQGYSFVNESSQGYMLVKFDTKNLKMPALRKVSAIMQDYTNSVSFDADGNFLIAAVDDPDVETVVGRISKLSPAYAKRITAEEDKPVEIPDDMDESTINTTQTLKEAKQLLESAGYVLTEDYDQVVANRKHKPNSGKWYEAYYIVKNLMRELKEMGYKITDHYEEDFEVFDGKSHVYVSFDIGDMIGGHVGNNTSYGTLKGSYAHEENGEGTYAGERIDQTTTKFSVYNKDLDKGDGRVYHKFDVNNIPGMIKLIISMF